MPETSTSVIVLRPPSDRIPYAVRSDSVRRPIGFRPPPNRIPSAVQSDSVRRPINFLHIYLVQSQYIHHNLQTLTKHIHSINTHILAFNPLKSPILVDLSQIEPKNEVFFETFLSKHLQGNDFCYTFASAFENELIELTTR